MKAKLSEQEMFDKGYIYLGEMGWSTKDRQANQLWSWEKKEMVVYNPNEEKIVWREIFLN